MATSFDQLVRELAAFRNSRAVVNACARGIRKATKPARKAIKVAARETLPKSGGLNVWVSRISILAQVRLSGRKAGVKLKGGRNSLGGRSDITAIDRGRVRAPSWGHRNANSWHTVTVKPGFFTDTAAALPDWRTEVDAEVDRALDTIRRG
ncbi:MAG TPA: hypothetical protein VFM50_02870 [Nocardioidaceae bacterium]|nr:hypothetical protein [Nocardioidaceae bacterium]